MDYNKIKIQVLYEFKISKYGFENWWSLGGSEGENVSIHIKICLKKKKILIFE